MAKISKRFIPPQPARLDAVVVTLNEDEAKMLRYMAGKQNWIDLAKCAGVSERAAQEFTQILYAELELS